MPDKIRVVVYNDTTGEVLNEQVSEGLIGCFIEGDYIEDPLNYVSGVFIHGSLSPLDMTLAVHSVTRGVKSHMNDKDLKTMENVLAGLIKE